MMEQRFLTAMVLVSFLALAVGPASGAVEISVTICCGQDDRWEWLQSVADAYMVLNPGVTVTPLFNVSLDQVNTMVAGGVGPDLIWVGQSWGSQISYLTPLNDFLVRNPSFTQNLVPGMTDGFTYNGRTYAIPFSASTRAFAYNADLFAAHGLASPTSNWTWDEALDMARRLTRSRDGSELPDQWGMALWWQPWAFLNYGGSMYSGDGRTANVDQSVVSRALGIFQDVWSGRTLVMPSGYVGESTAHGTLFSQGRIGFWDIGVYDLAAIRSSADFNWDVVSFPMLEHSGHLYSGGHWSGEGYGLYSGSQYSDEALRFALFMLSAERLVPLVQAGAILPASIPVLQDIFFQTGPPPANLEAMIAAIEDGGAPWAHPAFGMVMDYVFHPIMNQDPIHDGSQPIEYIVAEMQARWQRALDEFYAKAD